MSVTSEIERIKTNIANAYTEIENKGVIPTGTKNSDNLASTISAIQTGGTGGGSEDDEWFASYKSLFDDTLGANCTKLPDGLTSLGNQALINRTNLALTSLPDTITKIGNQAFTGCTNNKLEKLPASLTSIGTYAFSNNTYLNIKSIPQGVTEINNSVFNYCSENLTEITCYGNITRIYTKAFYYCQALAKFVLPNITSVPKLDNVDAFNATAIKNKNGYIYVPDNLVETFKSSTNWGTYANQIKPISELEE